MTSGWKKCKLEHINSNATSIIASLVQLFPPLELRKCPIRDGTMCDTICRTGLPLPSEFSSLSNLGCRDVLCGAAVAYLLMGDTALSMALGDLSTYRYC
jgi:hypothetical protein